ncbi:hypothetical protein CMEL01_10931 [Colletotrichum melonis]|uniref:Uncharacterized protein n=1 Tax=Colletotrichum melonis TaxID=1209925 RepID=A0AAI9Y0J1_9PEZI|nr:hypothetical protein CMEL01_10931 [Colletotrichum melonis]
MACMACACQCRWSGHNQARARQWRRVGLGTICGYTQHAMLFTTHHHHHHLLLLCFHFGLSRLSVSFPPVRCFGIRGKFLVGIDGKTVDEHTLVWFDTGLEEAVCSWWVPRQPLVFKPVGEERFHLHTSRRVRVGWWQ